MNSSAVRSDRRSRKWLARLPSGSPPSPGRRRRLPDRVRLWSMGAFQESLITLLLRLIFMVIVVSTGPLMADYLSGKPVGASAQGIMTICSAVATMLVVMAVGMNLYARASMFSAEILRPVTRREWIRVVQSSTVILLGIGMLSVFVITQTLSAILYGPPDPVWALLSLGIAVSYAWCAAGLILLAIVKRQRAYTFGCLALLNVGAVMQFAMHPGGFSVPSELSEHLSLFAIILIEGVLGAILLAWNTRAWRDVEPGRE